MQPEKQVRTNERRLVLGYDGGCFTCSDLAGRIEERMEGKIEVGNLRDPQVREWRKQALGNDAPWAPTLFEIKGTEIRAWTGWKMAANLGRFLGPGASWRVMQELGEVEAARPVERAGMSRGRFLRGMSGVAVAVTALSGGVLMPVTQASANSGSTGTEQQQRRAKILVRRTNEYQSLANLQARDDAAFDFPNALVKVTHSGKRAWIIVHSRGNKTAVLATFYINMVQGTLIHYFAEVLGMINSTDIKLTLWVNGRVPSRDHQTRIGENYVATYDNRLMTHEQYKREVEEAHQRREAVAYQTASSSEYENCLNREKVACYEAIAYPCAAVEGLGLALIPFSGGASAAVAGGAFVACGILGFSTCPDLARTRCSELAAKPIQQPPSYYC